MNNRELRQRVKKAFVELEKDGILCRSNFTCCTTCGSYEIEQLAKKAKAGGGIFWHAQDEDSLRAAGHVVIGYIGVGYPQIEVGQRAAVAFKDAGLKVDWNGNVGQRLQLSMPAAKK